MFKGRVDTGSEAGLEHPLHLVSPIFCLYCTSTSFPAPLVATPKL